MKLCIACSNLFYKSERAHVVAPPLQIEPATLGFDLVSGTDLKSLHLFYRYRKNFHMLGGSKFRLRQGFNLRPKYLLSVNAPPVRGWLVLLKQNRKQL